MKHLNSLSENDNKLVRNEYETPKCVVKLMAIDVITASDGKGESAYAWEGNGWSEALGEIFK